MFKKTLITLAIVSMTSGCSVLENIVDYGAKANDEAVHDSKFILCKGASIGAILREFDTDKKAKGWMHLCLGDEKQSFIIIESVNNE